MKRSVAVVLFDVYFSAGAIMGSGLSLLFFFIRLQRIFEKI